MKNINAQETKINLVVENISYYTDANASDFSADYQNDNVVLYAYIL